MIQSGLFIATIVPSSTQMKPPPTFGGTASKIFKYKYYPRNE